MKVFKNISMICYTEERKFPFTLTPFQQLAVERILGLKCIKDICVEAYDDAYIKIPDYKLQLVN